MLMSRKNIIMPLLSARVAIVLLMLISYPVASFLPVHAGWENGVVESTQVSFLMMGAFLACYVAYNESRPQWRWFAWMVVPIWILLIGREMSWGATFLVEPAFIDPELGPAYSSSMLGGFKMVTRVILVALLLFSAVVFLVTKQYKSVLYLFKQKMMPWFELGVAFIGAILCSAADGHGFIKFSSLSAGHLQTFEELLELGVYMSVFVAQAVVFSRLNKH